MVRVVLDDHLSPKLQQVCSVLPLHRALMAATGVKRLKEAENNGSVLSI